MVFSAASEKGPLRAARKYGDCDVRREICTRNGVALCPMRRVLVFVKSDGLALCGVSVGLAEPGRRASSLAYSTHTKCLDCAPDQVYGGGRLVGMRFVSVPTLRIDLNVISYGELSPLPSDMDDRPARGANDAIRLDVAAQPNFVEDRLAPGCG